MLLLLYGMTAAAIWTAVTFDLFRDAEVVLYTEAEALASYYAATGRLDFPELATRGGDLAIPVWLRILEDGRVIAQTPGCPRLPARPIDPARAEEVLTLELPDGGRFSVVRQAVWGRRGSVVEAIGALAPIETYRRRLLLALAGAALLLIPTAAFGGRFISQRALRPLDELVEGIRGLDSTALTGRLRVPEAVAEVAVISEEFNGLLDRLEESMNTMRRFTADASHELRNPLTVLRAGIEIALRRPRKAKEYRALLRENLFEIERVGRVVEGLLTMARESPGVAASLVLDDLDLSCLLEEVIAPIAAIAEEREVRVERDFAGDLSLSGNADLLRLMAFNLLDNALKHAPRGSRVRVAAEGRPAAVRLLVADQGPGVPPEHRSRLFQRFFRSGGGAGGLGLSVVRWAVECHGGEVCLLDTEIGAAFEILLPREPPPRAS